MKDQTPLLDNVTALIAETMGDETGKDFRRFYEFDDTAGIMAGDILFAIFKNKHTDLVWLYTLIDSAWVASYLLFAYSFFYTTATIKELDRQLLPRPRRGSPASISNSHNNI